MSAIQNRLSSLLLMVLVTFGMSVTTVRADAGDPTREDARLISATRVLEELTSSKDQRIPGWLLSRAYGVAVIPDVIKGAVVIGGRYGTGVLSIRGADGHFSNPVFVRLTGGSFGWQIGAQSADIVLIFASASSWSCWTPHR